MTRRAYLYFGLTFVLGALAGSAGLLLYGWYSGHWHRGFSKERAVRHLTRELGLSDTQVQQLNPIMDESMNKFSILQAQVGPQFDALHEERDNKIRKILTPEQLAKFNEMIRRWKQRPRRPRGP